jgi:RNA polymerase sigma factor (sigma-70 family)
MSDGDEMTTAFEASRPRLRAIATRMLGSQAEADDVVQDAWLRLTRSDAGRIDNLGGWLTTVTSRLCLDRLRTRRARNETPAADEAPASAASTDDPEQQAILADSVGAALLVVLDSLTPLERIAFVLHDVFGVPFDEVAPVVDRAPDAARQLASRARRRVQGARPAGGIDLVRQRSVVEAFLRAARDWDFEGLLRVLDPDVVLRPDAAAVTMGTLRETHGAAAVAGALAAGGARGARLATVDGVTGFVWAPAGRVRGVVSFTVVDDRIVAMDVTGDRELMASMEIVLLDDWSVTFRAADPSSR